VHPVEPCELAVRNGGALAEAGRQKSFPVQQRIEDLAGIELGSLRRLMRQFLQQLAFVGHFQRGQNAFDFDDVGKLHDADVLTVSDANLLAQV
jgi:hypothetical protein